MNIKDALFNSGVDLDAVSSLSGASCGRDTVSNSRIGDKENRISTGTFAVYIAKSAYREHHPYYKDYTDNILTLLPTYHFLSELRRQFSGTIASNESMFSQEEQIIYDAYNDWVFGGVYEGEVLQALETIDKWLVDEIQQLDHPELNRDYTSTHKWSKLEQRTV